MEYRSKQKNYRKKAVTLLLVLVMIVSMLAAPLDLSNASIAKAAETEQPVLVITGTGIAGSTDTSDLTAGIVNERAYTAAELQAESLQSAALFSAINTSNTKSVFLGSGTSVDSLLQNSNFTSDKFGSNTIKFEASDGYTVTFDPSYVGNSSTSSPLITPGYNIERYYYPNIAAGSDLDGSPVRPLLAFRTAGTRGHADVIPVESDLKSIEDDAPMLMVGQQNVDEMNNPLFNKSIKRIVVGEELPAIFTIGNTQYRRDQLLLMPRIHGTFIYSTKAGPAQDDVMGISLAELLKGYNDSDKVDFISADGYDNAEVTIADIKNAEKNYILAYEKNGQGIYDSSNGIAGCLRVYNTTDFGGKPIKYINEIKVTPAAGIDYSASPYKHITNGGKPGSAPYNVDAITGATLTVEGPGVEKSIPLSIREVENQNTGAYRGVYTDTRNSTPVTLTYEGIRLYHILKNMQSGDNGIQLTSKAASVQLKNRVRQTIAQFSLSEIEEADNTDKPILIAYGTSDANINSANPNIRPFVYDGGTGADSTLGNEDGCIKLVYDLSSYPNAGKDYTKFANVAYIYVSEPETPGYKHDKPPYDTSENSWYVLTVTGDKVGREINYKVKDLEAMVEYDAEGTPLASGLGYRDEYSLANSNYWYVNEYEGVKLWELLKKSGIPQSYAADANKDTIVKFSATDFYSDFDQFTLEQIANPDQFGFYEKNPADNNDGLYTGVPEDLKESGYPVLVAYGVNGYPYVIKSTLDGYLSGLGNDGGPIRIISGKLNYSHPNGSRQAKLLDKIIVGNDINYSTHSGNPGTEYAALKDNVVTVEVIGINGKTLKTNDYTIEQLEGMIYGSAVSNSEKVKARIKDFYGVAKNGNIYTDLYEGIGLEYFLKEKVQIPGIKGNITFEGKDAGGSPLASVTIPLDTAFATGTNKDSGKTGIKSLLAFAKNGYPMVVDKNADGYVKTFKDGNDNDITVKNDGGPLMLLLPQSADQAANNTATTLSNITKITVSLQTDKYAHIDEPYAALADRELTVEGAGIVGGSKTFKVSDLEGMQTIVDTGDYSINNGTKITQIRYRGLKLYDFLKSPLVGMQSTASEVVVTCADGTEMTFTLAQIMKTDYINAATSANSLKMLLAYGSGKPGEVDIEDGKPLVMNKEDVGYNPDYGNSGGPLRLVVGQMDSSDINSSKQMKDVVKITVNADAGASWTHDTGAYEQYLDTTILTIDGTALAQPKTYTLRQLENMDNLRVRDSYTVVSENIFEGIDVWGLIDSTVPGISNPTSIKVTASDGFAKDIMTFGMDAVRDGIKDGQLYKKIILAYGANGAPIVPDNTSDGYDSLAMNDGGPLRLITHNNQGSSIKQVVKITIDGSTIEEADFTLSGNAFAADISYSVDDLKALTSTTGEYTWYDGNASTPGSTTDSVKGVRLDTLLQSKGIFGDGYTVTLKTDDGFTGKGTYLNISMSDITAQNYIVFYESNSQDINDSGTKVRIYRNYNDGLTSEDSWYNRCTRIVGVEVIDSNIIPEYTFTTFQSTGNTGELPLAGLRTIVEDDTGGVWVGTYGGGAAYAEVNSVASNVYNDSSVSDVQSVTWKVYNSSSVPALQSDFVVDIAVDGTGGVWLTQSATYNPAEYYKNKGVAYLKNGELTYYNTSVPNTIPHDYVQEVGVDKSGNVWFGSFGGLTRYKPVTNEWKTWTINDGLPAASVDNFTFDDNGGVWIGFYPNGGETGPFSGGYAYLDENENLTVYAPEPSEGVDDTRLADFWVRDIAVDKEGGAWIVRSGSYATLENVGGRVDYVSADKKTIMHYTGKQLLPELESSKKDNFNPEIRTVDVDANGGLWFGTSGMGVYYCSKPGSVDEHYFSGNHAWPDSSGLNSIYAMLVKPDGKVYAGSNGGLAVAILQSAVQKDPGQGGGINPNPGDVGVTINGAVAQAKTFTIDDLKDMSGGRINDNYISVNSYGTVKSTEFIGVKLSWLLANMVSLNSNAKSITVTAADGYSRSFNLDSSPLGIYYDFFCDEDQSRSDVYPMMLAYQEGSRNYSVYPKLVMGQSENMDTNDQGRYINSVYWVGDIEAITVNAETVQPGNGTPGNYEGQTLLNKAKEGTMVKSTLTVKATEVNGKAQASINRENVDQLIKSFEGMDEEDEKRVDIVAEVPSGVEGTVINFAEGAFRTFVENDVDILSIQVGDFNVQLDNAAMDELAMQSEGKISISVNRVETDTLSEEAKMVIDDRLVIDIAISSGGKAISSLGNGTSVISMPYILNPGESESSIVVYYVDAQGKVSPLKICSYDANTGKVLFAVPHYSMYAIGYGGTGFSDTEDHWAKDYISFLAARDVVKGIGNGVFAPDKGITRAEFVTMLTGILEKEVVKAAGQSGVVDIEAEKWYTDSINWAVENQIVKGYENKKIGPDDAITREQMVVIITNFAKVVQITLKQDKPDVGFIDREEISVWAENAVHEMQKAGVIEGKDNNNFDPTGTATRAEATKMICTILKEMIYKEIK